MTKRILPENCFVKPNEFVSEEEAGRHLHNILAKENILHDGKLVHLKTDGSIEPLTPQVLGRLVRSHPYPVIEFTADGYQCVS